ncbi:MAG: ester cyclase [SAR202 cluster bacterium]|nr:ester cyclase [SAR202 cluster bacterium]MDP6713709.1 ester cyclase [SAR202 cluster bacterium]
MKAKLGYDGQMLRSRSVWGVHRNLAEGPKEIATSNSQELENNKAIVRRFFEEVVGGNLDLVDELLAPDCVVHGMGNEYEGAEAVRKNLERQKNTFAGWSLRVIFQIAQDDLVASHVSIKGTHTGEFLGVAPTGKDVDATGMFIDRVVDGKIVEGWHQPDNLSLLRQLGALT